MVWLLSLLLCSVLMLCILFVLVPELFPYSIRQRWLRHFHYFRY